MVVFFLLKKVWQMKETLEGSGTGFFVLFWPARVFLTSLGSCLADFLAFFCGLMGESRVEEGKE